MHRPESTHARVPANESVIDFGPVCLLPHVCTDPSQPCNQSGIRVQSNNVTIDGFTIQGNACGPAVMSIATVSGTQILDNIIQTNDFGIYLNSSSPSSPFTTLVSQNLIQNNTGTVGAHGNGIYSDMGLNNALIDNNTFRGQTNESIDLSPFENTTSNITISNNDFSTDKGIFVVNPTAPPLTTQNITIQSNKFVGTGNGGAAITFQGAQDVAGSSITGVNILNNNITNPDGNGIQLFDVKTATIEGNIVANSALEFSAGISLSGVNGLNILSNCIINNNLIGIELGSNSETSISSGIVVNGNNISGNGATTFPPGFGLVLTTTGVYTGTLNANGNFWGPANGGAPTDPNNVIEDPDDPTVVIANTFAFPSPVNCDPSPTITTVATSQAAVGETITDTATLSGTFEPTGTLQFQLFAPGPGGPCSTLIATLPAQTVTPSVSVYTGSYVTTAPGTLNWVVTYSGDANNAPFVTACGAAGETSVVLCIHGSSMISMDGESKKTKPICELKPNDMILGANGQAARVKEVVQCWLKTPHDRQHQRCIVFPPDSLGPGLPNSTLAIDPGHPMCLPSEVGQCDRSTKWSALKPAKAFAPDRRHRLFRVRPASSSTGAAARSVGEKQRSSYDQPFWTTWDKIEGLLPGPNLRYDIIMEPGTCGAYIANGIVVQSRLSIDKAGYEHGGSHRMMPQAQTFRRTVASTSTRRMAAANHPPLIRARMATQGSGA